MFKLSAVYTNIRTAVVLYCFVDSVVYTCQTFSAHGTVSSYVGFQNIVIIAALPRVSVGTGLVVLKAVRVTGAAFASPPAECYCAPRFSHTHYWYTVSIFKLSGVYQNISTAVEL